MNIRNATLTDASGIAKVHVDSWKTTYKDIMPDAFLQKLSYDQSTDSWIKNITKEGNYVFVAGNGNGKIIGFADCGKREGNQVDNSGDLTPIYLLEEYQGKVIGKQLMVKLFNQFEKLGFNRVFVEVLEDNKTRYFYEYYGAELLKNEKIKIAGAELNLLVYEWNNINKVLTKF
ncbi:GNAT family N-acetyltransferase [Bacillus pseudomycoides]|uniref:GNAT family N-acetyltransferase n=1 Tax=Bacillus pseudomycoides TaxID=64104 RepID=UPI000BEC4054|nr:GNAT family N-acetyltransferase [Bacillus pseudomycoides]PEF73681.1 GNAT family N-acetyltransferase [Bacillus pseudomycoides]PEL80087.1 GNAT family N-acetyltransferase [Bacillus pseudomycoides]